VSRRMGLFVVARLAGRHGIRVRLRPASMGGLTALVWLPDEVIAQETTVAPAGLRRFEVTPGSESEPTDWPEPDEPEDRSVAMEAVNAARTPKFAPLRPDLGDTGAFSVDADTGILPAAADFDALASAASSPGLSLSPPADGDDGPAHSLGSLRVPTFGADVASAQHDVIVPPPASLGEENRLPIFESVESDWFRRGGRHGADDAATAGTEEAGGPVSSDWAAPADVGWEAAEMAHAPVTGGTTVAGLPKRVPQANLVPGGVGSGTSPASPAPARSAAQTRERLAKFQRGVREGRAAAQDNAATGGEDGDTALYDELCAA
jgi:hypothetical protein